MKTVNPSPDEWRRGRQVAGSRLRIRHFGRDSRKMRAARSLFIGSFRFAEWLPPFVVGRAQCRAHDSGYVSTCSSLVPRIHVQVCHIRGQSEHCSPP